MTKENKNETHFGYKKVNSKEKPDLVLMAKQPIQENSKQTVQMLIEEVTKLNASDTILITAATGGVGRIFSQWAKSKGAVVIGAVGSKEKIITAKSYGCDHTLTYDQKDFKEKIMELTNGEGVDLSLIHIRNNKRRG